MEVTDTQKHKLKKLIKELDSYKARHTELITVYVPAEYDMNKIIQHLNEEVGTASNIKSTSTRNNVTAALEKMIQHLKLYKKTPEHGLAVFCGNVAEREGVQDIRVWSIEPPVPLKTRIYRCDKEFVLDLLRDMLEVKEIYGLIVIDRRDADVALLKGKTIIPLVKTHSHVPGKFKAGGQSSARFARQIEGAAKEHYRKVAEYVKEQFLDNQNLKGIIVGGPGPTKYNFIEEGQLNENLKRKIIAVKDLSYTGEFGLQELVEKSQDVLAKEEITAEMQIMQKFLELLAKKPAIVAYGENDVMEKLAMGVVETVLVSESLEDDEKLERIEEEAKKYSTTVKIISTDTREGQQLKDLGKLAAILRYEIHS